MSIAKLIRYDVGRWEGRSSLFFDSGLLSLVISAVTTKRPLHPSPRNHVLC
jgi:hypothetical protein